MSEFSLRDDPEAHYVAVDRALISAMGSGKTYAAMSEQDLTVWWNQEPERHGQSVELALFSCMTGRIVHDCDSPQPLADREPTTVLPRMSCYLGSRDFRKNFHICLLPFGHDGDHGWEALYVSAIRYPAAPLNCDEGLFEASPDARVLVEIGGRFVPSPKNPVKSRFMSHQLLITD